MKEKISQAKRVGTREQGKGGTIRTRVATGVGKRRQKQFWDGGSKEPQWALEKGRSPQEQLTDRLSVFEHKL